MKRVFFAAIVLTTGLAFAAHAETSVPPAPTVTCGATVKDCQAKVDDLTRQLQILTMQATALRNQRINAQAAADDANVNAAVSAQLAAAAAKPADPPKPK